MSIIGQIGLSGAAGIPNGPSLQAETIAYLTAASLPLTGGFALAIDAYVVAIKAAGAFTTDDEHYIFANATEGAGYINLINPSDTALVKSGSMTFSQYAGIKGDGSTGYLTTPTNMSSLSKLADTDGSIGYVVNGTTAAATSIDAGAADGSLLIATIYSSAPDVYDSINGWTIGPVSGYPELSPALVDNAYTVVSLTTASHLPKIYQNGTNLTFNQDGTSSPARTANPITIGAIPTFSSFSDRNWALFHIGASLTAMQVSARATAWANLVTALSGL